MYDTTSVIADVDFRAVVDHHLCEFKAGVRYDGATAVALLDGGCPVTQVGETKTSPTPRPRVSKSPEDKAAAKAARAAKAAAMKAEVETATPLAVAPTIEGDASGDTEAAGGPE